MLPCLRFTLVAALLALGLQSACIAALPGGGDKGTRPVAGDVITVTPLDAAPAGADVAPARVAPARVALSGAPRPKPRPKPLPEAAAVAKPVEAVAPEVAAAAEPPAKPKSPEEIRCGKKGGAWLGAGKTGAQACVKPTRDGGRHCRRQSDCEGLCLARSATCAPVQPLFGCNDILQDNGLQVTLCID